MRKIIIVGAAALAMSALPGLGKAGAAPPQGAYAIAAETAVDTMRQDVVYVCQRVWRCHSLRSCGWHRVCHWTTRRYVRIPVPRLSPSPHRRRTGHYLKF